MAMARLLPNDAPQLPFSLDEDFDEFTDKDHTLELVGYVCFVNEPTTVGKPVSYDLLKFGLSNGGSKKVQVLIWNLPLINLHKDYIVINRVVHIDGGHCKAARLKHGMEAQRYVPFEIVIQANTLVKYGRLHVPAIVGPQEAEPTDVTFETISQAEGRVSIDGYVKTCFASVQHRYGNSSYGCGSITDGVYKLTINISNFVPVALEKGVAVTVVGTVDPNSVPLTVNCSNMTAITRRENIEPMAELLLQRGVRNIKRRASAAA